VSSNNASRSLSRRISTPTLKDRPSTWILLAASAGVTTLPSRSAVGRTPPTTATTADLSVDSSFPDANVCAHEHSGRSLPHPVLVALDIDQIEIET
jgi:hypothetical protein